MTLAELLAAVGDARWGARKDAVEAARRWPDPAELLPHLVERLGGDDVAARGAAVEALAALGPAAVPALAALVASGAPERKFAIDALAQIAGADAARVVAAALADRDENVRAAAAEALGARPEAESEAPLRELLRGDGRLARLAALRALVQRGAALPLAELLPLLDDPILRPAALDAAGRSGERDALPHLLAALADGARGAREAAMAGLVALGERLGAPVAASVRAAPPAAVAGIIDALAGATSPARRAAIVLAGWGRWPDALPALAAALGDDGAGEAAAAAIARYGAHAVAPLVALADAAGGWMCAEILAVLPRLGAAAADRRVAELAERALAGDDPEVAAAAATALGAVGGRDALPALVAALASPDEELAAAAGAALVRIARQHPAEARLVVGNAALEGRAGAAICAVLAVTGHAADRPRLLAALRGGDREVRRGAAVALAALGAAEGSAPALLFALADEDPAVRAAAATALGRLGAAAAAPALEAACHDPAPEVAAAAARALGAVAAGAATLRGLVAARDAQVILAAVEALAALADPGDDALLGEAAGHADPEIAKAALRALGARPGASADAISRALEHPRWDVRAAAAAAARARSSE